MKLNKRSIVKLSLIFAVLLNANYIIPVFSASATSDNTINDVENWVEETKSVKGFIDFGKQQLVFGFGPSGNLERNNLLAKDTQLSKPNVYIKEGNSVINHLWGYQNSSSNFLLALPKKNDDGTFSNTDYKLYSSPGKGGKIYSLRNKDGDIQKIKGVVEKEIPGYGKVEFLTIIEKNLDNSVTHHVTIKNLDNKPLDFVYIKFVDTDLAGNDDVPVYMLGKNEGMYIETGNYRLDYISKVINGPDNIRNWYNAGYRNPEVDGFETMKLPFYPKNDLSGKGDESLALSPDGIVPGRGGYGRGDSGIWMKWNLLKLEPNESRTFTYGILLVNRFDSDIIVENKTRSKDALENTNYTKDTLTVKTAIKPIKKYETMPYNGKFTSELSILDEAGNKIDKKVFLDGNIKIIDESGNILREVPSTDVFDKDSQTINLDTLESDIRNGRVHIAYDIIANKEDNSFNNVNSKIDIKNRYEITFKDTYKSYSTDEAIVKIEKLYMVKHKFIKEGTELELPSEIEKLKPVDIIDKVNGEVVNPIETFEKSFKDDKNDGIWKFKQWNKESVTIDKSDEEFIGTWEFTSNKHSVTHKFISSENSPDLPKELVDLTPKVLENKIKGDVVTPSDDFEKSFKDDKNDGIWKFKQWNKESVTIDKSDEEFIGTWEFTSNKHSVTHKFISSENSPTLPKELVDLTPKVLENKIKGDVVTPSDDFEKSFKDDKNDGIWKFKQWNKESVTIDKSDEEFIGTWEFSHNKYKVIYKFIESDNSPTLPREILKFLPENILEKINGNEVIPSNDFTKTYTDNVNDGTWIFKNWNKDRITINRSDVEFVGIWEFKPNKYIVSHRFVKSEGSPELPKEIVDLTPKNIENKIKGDVVNPYEEFKKTFEDSYNDGVWSFKGWDKNSITIGKDKAEFIGTWEFVENYHPIPPKKEEKPNKEKPEVIEIDEVEESEELEKDEPKKGKKIKEEKSFPKTSIDSSSNLLAMSSIVLAGISTLKKKINKDKGKS